VAEDAVDHFGGGEEVLGRPHRRLVRALGAADVAEFIVRLRRPDAFENALRLDGYLDFAFPEAVGGTQRKALGREDSPDAAVGEELHKNVEFRPVRAAFGHAFVVVVVGEARHRRRPGLLSCPAVLQRGDEEVHLAVVAGEKGVRRVESGEIALIGHRAVRVDEVAVGVGVGERPVHVREVGVHVG
jgi:hypothetical protein